MLSRTEISKDLWHKVFFVSSPVRPHSCSSKFKQWSFTKQQFFYDLEIHKNFWLPLSHKPFLLKFHSGPGIEQVVKQLHGWFIVQWHAQNTTKQLVRQTSFSHVTREGLQIVNAMICAISFSEHRTNWLSSGMSCV